MRKLDDRGNAASPPTSPTGAAGTTARCSLFGRSRHAAAVRAAFSARARNAASKREARGAGIDPAWAYAIIRAESAWMTDAHSGADAYGLMQLLPGVAKQMAKSEKLAVQPAERPVRSGAQHRSSARAILGRMADRYDGSPWLASAAYNAGEAPVGRWLDARGVARSGFLHRDDSVQGNARIRRARARLQRDLRLAHERQGARARRRACRASARRTPRRPTRRRARAWSVRPRPRRGNAPAAADGRRATAHRRDGGFPLSRAGARVPLIEEMSHETAEHRHPRRHRFRRQPSGAAPARRRPHRSRCCRATANSIANSRVLPRVSVRQRGRLRRATCCAAQLAGADAAINLVGILNERGSDGSGFRKAHVELTETLIAACRAAGVPRLLQMSALRAGEGDELLPEDRGEAEARVKASPLAWTIFRPSVIFGEGDGLFFRFAQLLRMTPVLPLARARREVRAGPCRRRRRSVRARADPPAYGRPHLRTVRPARDHAGRARALDRRADRPAPLVIALPDALGFVQATSANGCPANPSRATTSARCKLDSVGKRRRPRRARHRRRRRWKS